MVQWAKPSKKKSQFYLIQLIEGATLSNPIQKKIGGWMGGSLLYKKQKACFL